MNEKVYIGDGVYVCLGKYGSVVLTTENGIRATNTIVLEPEVLRNFEQYIQRLRERSKQIAEKQQNGEHHHRA